MLQVEPVMMVLMLVAAVRARAELDSPVMPLAWPLLLGVLVLAGSAYLWLTYDVRLDPSCAAGLTSTRSAGRQRRRSRPRPAAAAPGPGASRSAILAALSTSSSASRTSYAAGPASRAVCSSTVLCQTFCRASRRNRLDEIRLSGWSSAVEQRTRRAPRARRPRPRPARTARRRCARGRDAARHQHGVGEVLVGDDGQQGLGQVVVDVRVDAEQDVPQRRQVGGRVEGEPPGTRTGCPPARWASSAATYSSANATSHRSTQSASSNTPPSTALPTARSCAGRCRGTPAGRPGPPRARRAGPAWCGRRRRRLSARDGYLSEPLGSRSSCRC